MVELVHLDLVGKSRHLHEVSAGRQAVVEDLLDSAEADIVGERQDGRAVDIQQGERQVRHGAGVKRGLRAALGAFVVRGTLGDQLDQDPRVQVQREAEEVHVRVVVDADKIRVCRRHHGVIRVGAD